MSLIVDEHRQYLANTVRIDAFRRAIQHVVRPGFTVVDLGSGTGILGLLACEAGASRVYSIEAGPIVTVARALARANGFADRVVFIRDLSTRVELPERVDVVIADQIGHFGFEAGLWEYFADAKKRFLKPGGVMVPGAVSLVVAPVEAPEFFGWIDFWDGHPAGFDCSAARSWAAHTGYPADLPADALLAPGITALHVEMKDVAAMPFSTQTSMEIARSGTLHGIGGWFEAELAPAILMTNAPTAADRIKRRNVYLPIERAVAVRPGDRVEIALHVDPVETMLSWTVEVHPVNGAIERFNHSTLHGMLLDPVDLRRTSPRFRPVLTPRGVARRTVLELCDGQRPVQEIEAAVLIRHRDLFPSATDAAVFVAEVVTRYSE